MMLLALITPVLALGLVMVLEVYETWTLGGTKPPARPRAAIAVATRFKEIAASTRGAHDVIIQRDFGSAAPRNADRLVDYKHVWTPDPMGHLEPPQEPVRATQLEHAVLLVGHTRDKLVVNNPLTGRPEQISPAPSIAAGSKWVGKPSPAEPPLATL
jgi:hypothetical protein